MDISETNMDEKIRSLSLKLLPERLLNLLSCLLNPEKATLTDEPRSLHRDWRGLASLINITSQLETYIRLRPDPTGEVISMWKQRSPAVTVGDLLRNLELIDRFDVRDDMRRELRVEAANGLLKAAGSNQQVALQQDNAIQVAPNGEGSASNGSVSPDVDDNMAVCPKLLTYHDHPGHEQQYDALVLYADEDQAFVDRILQELTAAGLLVCTRDVLLLGQQNEHAAVTELIAERCLRIILVLSPDFVKANGLKYYANYSQALSIETNELKMLPIEYRKCDLPCNLAFCTKLVYQPLQEPRFWFKLTGELVRARAFKNYCRNLRVNRSISEPSTSSQRVIVQEPRSVTNYLETAGFLSNTTRGKTSQAILA